MYVYVGRQPLAAGGKPVERVEEKRILDTLHEEGLIKNPTVTRTTAFGVGFEIFSDDTTPIRRLPPRLAKLETKKKKKKVLTEEQIRQKLERAEIRKKVSNTLTRILLTAEGMSKFCFYQMKIVIQYTISLNVSCFSSIVYTLYCEPCFEALNHFGQ